MFDLREVALSALLHDVGKLLQRGSGTPQAATHSEFGRTFLRELGYSEAVCEAALRHHGRGREGQTVSEASFPSTRVVYAADNVASSFRREGSKGRGFDPSAPLHSIFNFIHRDVSIHNEGRSYPLTEHGKGGVNSYLPREPDETRAAGSYRRLKDGLVEAFGKLGDPEDVVSVLNLLERYGSYVRSTTSRSDTGDISLFDHSRVTAALAVCIAGHLNEMGTRPTMREVEDQEAPRYLFVRGDISGVQKFIYTITSKGALRMLRARSFYLELVAEHTVARILELCGVPRTNTIYVGGGGFQLLLPNTGLSAEAVETVGRELNAVLASSFGRDLYLTLATLPCAASGITGDGLGETLRELGRTLSEQKARKHREDLHRLFAEQPEPAAESCDVCTRDDAPVTKYEPRGYEAADGTTGEEPVALCETCRMLARASRKLVGSLYLVEDGGDLYIGETGYGLSQNDLKAVYALNDVGDEACLRGVVPLPAARYAARDEEQEGQIMDFGKLSGKATGASRLAVLRMDVDNLGETFRTGLPEQMRTFDRYAALSRAFTTFFKVVVPEICAGNYESSLRLFGEDGARAASLVYSGGDDLFVVGAWSDVLELAVDVRQAFRKFVCENPAVTLSGGVSIHAAGEPLYLMAEQAGMAEETAKNNKENGREKDSAVLFYRGPDYRTLSNSVPEALFWDEVEDGVVSLLQRINEFRRNGELPFPRSFTRLLMDVVDVYEQEGHLSLPRLAYALARMEESGKLKHDERWRELKRELLKVETVKKYLRPAAYWLDLAERKGE